MKDLTMLPDLAETINKEYEAAQSDARSAVQHAIACGKALIEAKAQCKHGEWLPWLKANVEVSDETARKWMALANSNHDWNLIRPDSIREALRLLDKPEPKEKGSRPEPKPLTAIQEEHQATIVEMTAQGKSPTEIATVIGTSDMVPTRALAKMMAETLITGVPPVVEDADELKSQLSITAQQKLEKAVKAFEQKKIIELREEFQVELANAIKREKDALEAEKKELTEKKKALEAYEGSLAKRATSITTIMTQDEFKMVRGCLHPDRQPEELRDRFGRAFDIFSRLEQTVNIAAPIDWLRKYGWEKVSPRFKPSRH